MYFENGYIYFDNEAKESQVFNASDNKENYNKFQLFTTRGVREFVESTMIPYYNGLCKDKNLNIEFTSCKNVEVSNLYSDNDAIAINITLEASNGRDLRFRLCILDSIKENGLLSYNGNYYAFINFLQKDSDITLETNKELTVTGRSMDFKVMSSNRDSKVMFSLTKKRKLSYFELYFMLAHLEGVDYKDAIKRLFMVNDFNHVRHLLPDSSTFTSANFNTVFENSLVAKATVLTYALLEETDIKYMLNTRYRNAFDISDIRASFKDMFKANAAIGRVLSRNVYTFKGELLYAEGTEITPQVASDINEKIYGVFYVKSKFDALGKVLSEPVFIGDVITAGAPANDFVKNLIGNPNYKYNKIAEHIKLNQPLALLPGTVLTEDILELIEHYGFNTLSIKPSASSEASISIYNDEEFFCLYNSDNESLTSIDVLALLSLFYKVRKGKVIDNLTNMDLGFRKKLQSPYDAYLTAFKRAFASHARYIENKALSALVSLSRGDDVSLDFSEMYSRFSERVWRVIKDDMKCYDSVDFVNPFSTYHSMNKINAFIKDKNSIKGKQRHMTMGHYGRICPYETPQSFKLGAANTKALGLHIKDNKLQSIYWRVEHNANGKSFIKFDQVYSLSVADEERVCICDRASLDYDKVTGEIFTTGRVPARVPNLDSVEKFTYANVDVRDISYVNRLIDQTISATCASIPFIGSNDAARIQFAASMIKQAKPLVYKELPRVLTRGCKDILERNNFFYVSSPVDGVIDEVTRSYISIKPEGKDEIIYEKFIPSVITHNAVIAISPSVREGDRVSKGDEIANTVFSKDGFVSLGANALVVFMNDGYNYEDGLSISKEFSKRLVSNSIHKEEVSLETKGLREVKLADYADSSVNNRKYYSPGDVITFTYVLEDKGKKTEHTYKHTCVKTKGFFYDLKLKMSLDGKYIDKVELVTISIDPLSRSDKTCNRHGNKGVTCRINNNEDMPFLSNGYLIDVKYNPLGVSSRMNMGQILELKLGLALTVLNANSVGFSFNYCKVEDIKFLVSLAYHLANAEDFITTLDSFKDRIPTEFYTHCLDNMHNIQNWKGVFDEEGKAYVYSPKSGINYPEKYDIGYIYIHKLVQEGFEKKHSRPGISEGADYQVKTMTPTKGAAAGGGQRMGYMEIDNMLSYGASNMIYEQVNALCDNPVEKTRSALEYLNGNEYLQEYEDKKGTRMSVAFMNAILVAMGLYPSDSFSIDTVATEETIVSLAKDNNEPIDTFVKLSQEEVKAIVTGTKAKEVDMSPLNRLKAQSLK